MKTLVGATAWTPGTLAALMAYACSPRNVMADIGTHAYLLQNVCTRWTMDGTIQRNGAKLTLTILGEVLEAYWLATCITCTWVPTCATITDLESHAWCSLHEGTAGTLEDSLHSSRGKLTLTILREAAETYCDGLALQAPLASP